MSTHNRSFSLLPTRPLSPPGELSYIDIYFILGSGVVMSDLFPLRKLSSCSAAVAVDRELAQQDSCNCSQLVCVGSRSVGRSVPQSYARSSRRTTACKYEFRQHPRFRSRGVSYLRFVLLFGKTCHAYTYTSTCYTHFGPAFAPLIARRAKGMGVGGCIGYKDARMSRTKGYIEYTAITWYVVQGRREIGKVCTDRNSSPTFFSLFFSSRLLPTVDI